MFLEFILDTRPGWEEEGRSLDHCPDVLNLEASLSTNKSSRAQLHLSHTELKYEAIAIITMYVFNVNTALRNVEATTLGIF